MVGAVGSLEAAVVGVGEAPGADEEGYLLGRAPYGAPFVGASGHWLRANVLVPGGMARFEGTRGVTSTAREIEYNSNILLCNVLLCRPPNNKIASREGRVALLCCLASFRAFVHELLTVLPPKRERAFVAMGDTAATALFGTSRPITAIRGRVFELRDVPPGPTEDTVDRYALRGVKPPPAWTKHEKILKAILAVQRRWLKKNGRLP